MTGRIALLREMEASCYGVCLYLLEDENRAAAAARAALIRLYYDEEFWRMSEDEKKGEIRHAAAVFALNGRP